MDDVNSANEISLKNIRKVLADLFNEYSYDMENAKELINVKHSHLNGISYPIFKECLFEWLQKQQKILSTTIFVDDNNINEDYIGRNNEERKNHNYDTEVKNENNFNFTEVDVDMIILHRSLFILKRKFEIYEKEVYEIYRKYFENEKMDHVIDIKKFNDVVRDILKEMNIAIYETQKPNEVLKLELLGGILDLEKIKIIHQHLEKHMLENRMKYNEIMKEKKEKGFVKLNKFKANTQADELSRIQDNSHNLTNNDDLLDLVSNVKQDTNRKYRGMSDQSGDEILDKKRNNKPVAKVSGAQKLNNLLSKKQSAKNIENDDMENVDEEQLDEDEDDEDDSKKNTKKKAIKNEKNFEEDPDRILTEETIIKKNKKDRDYDNESTNSKLQDELNRFNKDLNEINLDKSREGQSLKKGERKDQNLNSGLVVKDDRYQEDFDLKTNRNVIEVKNNKNIKGKGGKLNKNQLLLIEILPLIIADFVQENKGKIILDINEELRTELRTLFDNEILQRLGEMNKIDLEEDRSNKLKELLLEKLNLEKNLRTYEDLLIKKRSIRENAIFIEQMLMKLKKQKRWVENKIKVLQEDNEVTNNYNLNQANNPNNINNQNNQNNSYNDVNNSKINANDNSNINQSNDDDYYKKSKVIPRKNMSKQELRQMTLKEIFLFYSKQHQLVGKFATFDLISGKTNRVDLSEFTRFCVEFKIMARKDVLVELFKKTASDTKLMVYEEFVQCLEKISMKVNEEKKNALLKRIHRLRQERKTIENKKSKSKSKSPKALQRASLLNSPEVKEMFLNRVQQEEKEKKRLSSIPYKKLSKEDLEKYKEMNRNSSEETPNEDEEREKPIKNNNKVNNIKIVSNSNLNKQRDEFENNDDKNNIIDVRLSLVYNNKKEINQDIKRFKAIIDELNEKTNDQLLEDLYQYMEIDKPKVYRLKMKGFIPPFHIVNQEDRIPQDQMKKVKKVNKSTANEIRRILQTRKEEKLQEKEDVERTEKLKNFEQKKKLKELNEKISSRRDEFDQKKNINYVDIKKQHDIYEREKETKLTWEQLENLNYKHFMTNRDDDFNPKEYVDEEYDSDDAEAYLAHMKLEPPREQTDISKESYRRSGNNQSTTLDNSNHVGSSISLNRSKEKSINNYHDHNYFVEKTEKNAKELERSSDNKKVKVNFL